MLNLMIIDDDVDDLFFFREAVATMGGDFRCIEETSGAGAFKYLKNAAHLPDAIFLDLNMPKMDGKEFLAELKNDARLKQIAIVIYSTSTYKKDRNFCMELGASCYFVKLTDTTKIKEGIFDALKFLGIYCIYK